MPVWTPRRISQILSITKLDFKIFQKEMHVSFVKNTAMNRWAISMVVIYIWEM